MASPEWSMPVAAVGDGSAGSAGVGCVSVPALSPGGEGRPKWALRLMLTHRLWNLSELTTLLAALYVKLWSWLARGAASEAALGGRASFTLACTSTLAASWLLLMSVAMAFCTAGLQASGDMVAT